MDLFNLDKAVRDWRRGFQGSEAFEDGVLAELESHLREEFARRRESGMSGEQAFAAARSSVGSPDLIGREFFKDRARSLWAGPLGPTARFAPLLIGSHVKVALRKLRRRKGMSLISLLGLAVGMAACLLIAMWVRDERGFDRFHRNADRLYRLVLVDRSAEGTFFNRELPSPVAEALRRDVPEIEAAARTYSARFQVRHGDKVFNEYAIAFVDPSYFDIFSFPDAAGRSVAALSDPSSIVLTEEMAGKYFGAENPLGKTLNLDNRNDYKVAAIVRVPRNTDLRFDAFLPLRALEHWGISAEALASNWRGRMYRTYLRRRPGADPGRGEARTAGLLKSHNPGRDERLRLQPLADMHLYGPDGRPAGMRIVVILSLVSALILVIACVNYVNLATAQAGARAKEIGLRKTVGASRAHLIRQILVESLLLSFLAMALSLALGSLALPSFNGLTGKQLSLNVADPALGARLLAIALLAGFLAGFYPALALSNVKPANVLKARAASPRRGAGLRKGLLLFQFSVSTLLLIATAVILTQLRYIQTREIGFDRENLVYVTMMGRTRDTADILKKELARHPQILAASASDSLPSQIIYQFSADWEGRPVGAEVEFHYAICDFDYVKTFRMTIVAGRDFSPDRPADQGAFLINEEAARRMGVASPVGTRLRFMDGRWGEIIGIVKDFNFSNMGTPIRPLVLTSQGRKSHLIARLAPGNPAPALAAFREVWNRINPGFVFDYGFVDSNFDKMYGSERQLGRIVGSFSVLAIVISCLGLIGLASFTAERKTKEMGIRKILGADSAEIARRLASDLLQWVALANLIAWPAAAWLMGRWLESYAYRTRLSPWMFAGAGLASILVAVITISFQTLKAAWANPVESLRAE